MVSESNSKGTSPFQPNNPVTPLAYHLQKVPFGLYVTLTFGTNWTSSKTRNKVERLYSWLRFIYGHHCSDRTLSDKEWLVAEELGEVGERYHVHLLIGSLPKRPTKTDCFAMAWLWKDQLKGGYAKIRPYNPSLNGVGYVLKSLSLTDLRSISSESGRIRVETLAGAEVGRSTTYAGANAYEIAKIGNQHAQGLEVTLSLGLQRRLQAGANERRGTDRSVSFFRRKRSERCRVEHKG